MPPDVLTRPVSSSSEVTLAKKGLPLGAPGAVAGLLAKHIVRCKVAVSESRHSGHSGKLRRNYKGRHRPPRVPTGAIRVRPARSESHPGRRAGGGHGPAIV